MFEPCINCGCTDWGAKNDQYCVNCEHQWWEVAVRIISNKENHKQKYVDEILKEYGI